MTKTAKSPFVLLDLHYILYLVSYIRFMDYILFGIQGSGKGTQGKILAAETGSAYFETGGELRRLAAEESHLGQKVKSIITAGHLVPNEVVMEIVENFVKNSGGSGAQTIIFDGIPRNNEQNNSLENLLKKLGRQYTGIYFELSREDALNRLITRRICSKCKEVYPSFYKNPVCEKCRGELVTRADDNADSIKTRIDIFYKETLPIIENWEKRGKIIKMDASLAIEEITKNLLSRLAL